MSVSNISMVNTNPFNVGYSQKPPVTNAYFNNFFSISDKSVNVPIETSKINALNLKDDLLARFFPQKFIAKYLDNGFISKQIQNNPKIKELLAQKGVEISINPQNVIDIVDSHLVPALNCARLIMQKSGISFSPQDYAQMEQAALLHDIGKIFIPVEILNKKSNLTENERKIIELHDTLGVELLRGTQLPITVLNLIASHHSYGGNEDNGILTQILKIADVYSALKENRSYKSAMSDDLTFKFLYDMAYKGEFNPKLVDVLKQAISNENLQKTTIA